MKGKFVFHDMLATRMEDLPMRHGGQVTRREAGTWHE